MIIIVCTDDPNLVQVAQGSINANPGVYGDYYLVFDEQIPALRPDEDLFIISHGSYEGDDGNPVIGDRSGDRDFYLNAVDLFDNLESIFPLVYTGNVYVDACESADHDYNTFSFIEVLQAQLYRINDAAVFGRNGTVGGLIPLPRSRGWIQADFDANNDTGRPRVVTEGDGGGNLPPYNGNESVVKTLPSLNDFNIQAVKRYVFNETGNIMMATTELDGAEIKKSVREVFAEVSVFFAALTKAITTTINPETNKPYSLYNYEALTSIIGGSGMFVHVNEEDIQYSTTSVGAEFSKELVEAVIGLATGAGEMTFASAMINSMGKEGLNIGGSHSSSNTKIANIIFVCEYLLGMPIVSALVVYMDLSKNSTSFNIGPCIRVKEHHSKWIIHKDTFMFVTPNFIREYADDLLSVETDQDYKKLVQDLKNSLGPFPKVTNIKVKNNQGKLVAATSPLASGTTYYIVGTNFGQYQGSVKFGTASVTVLSWTENSQTNASTISFTATTSQTMDASPITIETVGFAPITRSAPSTYKLNKPSH